MKSQQKLPKATKKKPMSKKAFVALAHKVEQSLQEEQQEKCTCIDTTEGHNLYCPLNNQLTSPHSEAWINDLSRIFLQITNSEGSRYDLERLEQFIRTLLHQTHEETVREMEGIIGSDQKEPKYERNPQEFKKKSIVWSARNQLRKEQRQRLAQAFYKANL